MSTYIGSDREYDSILIVVKFSWLRKPQTAHFDPQFGHVATNLTESREATGPN